jgi:periplasmic protein TonB
MTYGGVTLSCDSSWIALGLVVCAHLGTFAALRPQSQSLPLETVPEPITVSLLSAPQATPQQPKPVADLTQKGKNTVKPKAIEKKLIKQPAKRAPIVRKTPVSKPIVAYSQSSPHATAVPVEQASLSVAETSSQPIAASAATSTRKPATDSSTYQAPSFNAAYLDNPAPNYPSVSRRLGEQGKVLLRVQVAADGTADSVTLQTSSGSSRLDQAALAAVKKWRFVPAKRGGQAVSASVVVPVSFSIEG